MSVVATATRSERTIRDVPTVRCVGGPTRTKLLTLTASEGSVHRLVRLGKAALPPAIMDRVRYLASPLRYAEDRPRDLARVESAAYGWDTDAVAEREGAKWAAFTGRLSDSGLLGFSHEAPVLDERDNLYHHNVVMDFAFALGRALAHSGAARTSILDWGGGLGHYAAIARALYPRAPFDYAIKETPAMATLGRRLNPEVRWFDDDACFAHQYDLVVVNASLQYMQDWRALVPRLAASSRAFAVFLRIPVVRRAATFRAIQRAYDREMVHLQFNEAELMACAASAGLDLDRELLVGGHPFVRGAPEQPTMRGWLFRTWPPADVPRLRQDSLAP